LDRLRLGVSESASSALQSAAVEAVGEVVTSGRPVASDDEALAVRFETAESAAGYWQELSANVTSELSESVSFPASASPTGSVSASEAATIANAAWWVELSVPPAPGTVWSILTPSAPVDAGKALLSFDYADRFAPEAVLMSSRGNDCITAKTSWRYDERRFLFDFWVTVEPATSDPSQLSGCFLCTDVGGGLDVAMQPISFTGGRQRERVSVVSRGVGRLFHDGPFTLRFERCVITVVD
jgi:hypothetical protein